MSALRPLSIGEILDGSFSVYRRQFLVLFVTAAALGLPATVLGFGAEPGVPSMFDAVVMILGGVLGLVSSIALTAQVSTALLGGQPTLAEGIAVGARRFLPVLGALAWTTLFVLVVIALPLGLVLGGVGWLLRPEVSGLQPIVFVLVASVLVLVLVTVLTTIALRYFAVLAIATLESARGVLKRSALLARGAYWKISVVWFVGGLIYGLPLLAVGAGSGAAELVARSGDGPGWLSPLATVLVWLVSALAMPFTAALNTLLYYDQRVRKDGLDVQLAAERATPAPPPAAMPRPVGS